MIELKRWWVKIGGVVMVLTGIGTTGIVLAGPDLQRDFGKGGPAQLPPPLFFETNQGQTDPSVKFLARGKGYTVFLTPSEAVLSLRPPAGSRTQGPEVVRMKLAGAKAHPTLQGQGRLTGHSSYFSGRDARTPTITTEQFAKVSVQQVYPGIDLVYYGKNGDLEYDFVVAPGADPKLIRMKFEVSQALQLDAEGQLILKLADTQLVFHAPVVYQAIGDTRKIIPGKFVLAKDHHVEFAIGAYDRSKELVIDPSLTYSTYLGTTVEDRANAIAVDASDNVYLTGRTASVADKFPNTTPDAGSSTIQASNNGGAFDVFVIKMNSAGAIQWATYLGGAGDDIGKSIAVDATGRVYLTGSTTFTAGTTYPFVTGYRDVNSGGTDAFITAINPTGTALIYSTYIGGAGEDVGTSIVVDSAGNAYVTGGTTSDNSTRSATAGAYQTNNGGPGGAVENAFVAKFNAAGTIQYFTYLGGSVTGGTRGNAIAIDGTGNAYVTGYCRDTFPTFPSGVLPLPRAFKLTIGGAQDAFVSKISPSGANLLYSTYLGGSGISQGMGIKVDSTGNVYVTGDTDSTNFPDATTDGNTVGFAKVGQTTIVGNFDAFVFKLAMNATGHTDGVYCTFLGGSGLDHVNALVLDSFGDAYVTGRTESSDFLSAGPGSIQTPIETVQNGTAKAFVTVIGPSGSTRLLNTYIGGVTDQEGQGIGLDSGNNIWVSGWTNSTGFPTASPQQAANRGSYDAFVLKISPTSPPAASPPTITSLTPTLGTVLGGTTVIVTGTGFSGVTSVQFGGTNAFSYTVASSTVITAVTPGHVAGTVDVVVTTTAGANANTVADDYVYTPVAPAAGPTLTAIAPTFGPTTGGTSVKLTGTGLTGVTLVVFVAGSSTVNAFSFIVNSDTLITAITPAHVSGVVDTIVKNSLGTSPVVSADQFTFLTPAPVITGLSPILGTIYGGTTVAITGTGLTGVTLVSFGTTSAASFTVNSDSLITAVTPAHVAGAVDVRATNPVSTTPIVAADQFTFFTPPPVITGIIPKLGVTTGGTTVVISGTGFTGVTGAAGVQFGGVNAASYVVNSDTRISAVSPTHDVGTVDIIVTAPVGPSAITAADQFTYFFTPVVAGTVAPFDPYVFPSPANKSSASVAYYLASSGNAKARFYNEIGVLVATTNETGQSAGANTSVFEVGDWAPGVYFCLLNVTYDDGTSVKYSRLKFVVTR